MCAQRMTADARTVGVGMAAILMGAGLARSMDQSIHRPWNNMPRRVIQPIRTIQPIQPNGMWSRVTNAMRFQVTTPKMPPAPKLAGPGATRTEVLDSFLDRSNWYGRRQDVCPSRLGRFRDGVFKQAWILRGTLFTLDDGFKHQMNGIQQKVNHHTIHHNPVKANLWAGWGGLYTGMYKAFAQDRARDIARASDPRLRPHQRVGATISAGQIALPFIKPLAVTKLNTQGFKQIDSALNLSGWLHKAATTVAPMHTPRVIRSPGFTRVTRGTSGLIRSVPTLRTRRTSTTSPSWARTIYRHTSPTRLHVAPLRQTFRQPTRISTTRIRSIPTLRMGQRY